MSDELESVLRQLSERPQVAELARALREHPGARLHVAPALTAARPALIAALAEQLGGPLLYIVANSDAAMRAREDLCQWLGPEAVLLFPSIDALPYEPMSPGIEVIAGRLQTLAR